MQICATAHEPICFKGEICPLCTEIGKRILVEEELAEVENEVVALREKLESLKT